MAGATDSGLAESADAGHDHRPGCIFCAITSGRAPARFEYLVTDEGALVPEKGVIAFHNQLEWARVMLLVVPRDHMSQAALWSGPALTEAASLAVMLGEKLCPEGFRVLSNFGRPAHQSQEHAHIHVVSTPDSMLPDSFEPPDDGGVRLPDDIEVSRIEVIGVPWSARVASRQAATQRALWTGESFPACARAAVELASRETPDGFRLISNFHSPATGVREGGAPGLLVLGGGELDLYA